MAHIAIHLSANFSSVTVDRGASRQTSARSVVEMVNAMPAEDRQTLIDVCCGLADLAAKCSTVATTRLTTLLERTE